MFNDYVEPFDYMDTPRFEAQMDFERSIIEDEDERRAEQSLLRAEEADEILENF